MSTPAATAAPSMPHYRDEDTTIASRIDVNRDKPRYIFSLGDHIVHGDKQGFKSLGAYMGGLWVGPSEVEGAPCMKRTNFMVYRGGIIPLETTAIPKKADHREAEKQNEQYLTGENVPPGTRGYTVYAGDSLNFLQGDRFRPMGIVELDALKYRSWRQSHAPEIQLWLFPQWNQWLQGVGRIPTRLDDWMGLVTDAFNRYPELRELLGEEIAEAYRLFRVYARRHIERNRQQITSKRNVDTGGQFSDWSGLSYLYAEQLGQTLESPDEIRPTQTVTATGDPALLQELREERRLRREEMQQQQAQTQQMFQILIAAMGANNPAIQSVMEQFTPAAQPGPEVEVADSQVEETGTSYDDEPTESELAILREGLELAGNEIVDEEEEGVGLTEPAESADSLDTEEREQFETQLNDPVFADAVETDAGLRGALAETPSLRDYVAGDEDDE